MIHLRGGLVVPRTPGLTAVYRDDGALIADQQNDLGVIRIDPEILIIVAARRAAEASPRLGSICRFPCHRAGDIDHVGILRINARNREIAATDASRRPRIGCCLGPALASVIRTIDGNSVLGCDGRIQTVRIAA